MGVGKKIAIGVASILAIDFLIAQFNNPRIILRDKLPFNYNAQTIPPFVIMFQKEDAENPTLVEHELFHWKQYQRTGAIIFHIKYFIQNLMYGYDKMPLEVEARKYVGENEYCQQNYTECVRNGQSITIEDKNFRT